VRNKGINEKEVTVKRKRKIISIKKIVAVGRRKRGIETMINMMIAMNAVEVGRRTKKRKNKKIKSVDLVRMIRIEISVGLMIDVCCKQLLFIVSLGLKTMFIYLF